MAEINYRCERCGSNNIDYCKGKNCFNINQDSQPKSDVEENSDEEIREFPIHEYYIHGLYDIHISDIINTVGIQFETMSDAFAWRLQKLEEMKEWDWEEANEYEFPFLVCVPEKRFITPVGSTMHFSRFLKN